MWYNNIQEEAESFRSLVRGSCIGHRRSLVVECRDGRSAEGFDEDTGSVDTTAPMGGSSSYGRNDVTF